jgi:hypothetical protein
MSSLAEFWRKNKKGIGEGLKGGIKELAGVLQTGAADFDLVQKDRGETIQWTTQEEKPQILFCRVPDPRDLGRILESSNRPGKISLHLLPFWCTSGRMVKAIGIFLPSLLVWLWRMPIASGD